MTGFQQAFLFEYIPNFIGYNKVMTNPASVISTFGQLSFRRVSEKKSVPEKKRWLSAVLFSTTKTLIFLLLHTPLILPGQNLNRPPSENEINYSPSDGDVVTTNPPAFIWLFIKGKTPRAVAYSNNPMHYFSFNGLIRFEVI